MQGFIEEMGIDLNWATRIKRTKNFSEFLKGLSEDRLELYYKFIGLYENSDSINDDPELLQKAIIFYSMIMVWIEDPNPENQVQIDGEGEWLARLVYFLGLEKLRRADIIEDYEGELKSGDVTQKAGPSFIPYIKHMAKTLSQKEKEKYTKMYGKDLWKDVEKN